MADRRHRGEPGSTGEHDRGGVFRRGGDPGKPDEFEKLYRPRESEQRVVGETRRIPPADQVPPHRPKKRRTHSAGREYDGRGHQRRAKQRRKKTAGNTVLAVLVLLRVIPGAF